MNLIQGVRIYQFTYLRSYSQEMLKSNPIDNVGIYIGQAQRGGRGIMVFKTHYYFYIFIDYTWNYVSGFLRVNSSENKTVKINIKN